MGRPSFVDEAAQNILTRFLGLGRHATERNRFSWSPCGHGTCRDEWMRGSPALASPRLVSFRRDN